MPKSVEIDSHSGFCAGVIRAIKSAERHLDEKGMLYSLGSIVHNEEELQRLSSKGLRTVNSIDSLPKGETILIRAHGEPPSTYRKARQSGVTIIDCTCPVVLKLQQSIKEAYQRTRAEGGQIIIFGKIGHAEVLGLLGQAEGKAEVVENMDMLKEAISDGRVRIDGPIEVFSQTTKSPSEYRDICSFLEEEMARERGIGPKEFRSTGDLKVHQTICRQVASRHEQLSTFARDHDIIVFVSGNESSNGKVLGNLCKSVNERTYRIGGLSDIHEEWFRSDDRVGVCGATSTPRWLLDAVAQRISRIP